MAGNIKDYASQLENLANQPGLANLISELLLSSSRATTKLVAANDASDQVKQAADFLCDGVDDQMQIQAAIAALPACGGKITLSEGQFNFSAHVALVSNVDFEGSGTATLLYLVDASNDHVLYGDTITKLSVKDLRIDSNSAGQTSPPSPYKGGIYFRDVTHFRVSDVHSEYAPGHCIDIGDGCEWGVVHHATTSYAYDDGVAVSGTASSILLTNCFSHHNGLSLIGTGSGIEIDDGANLVTVIGCSVHDNEAGISVHTHAGKPECYDVALSANLIYDNDCGIRMHGFNESLGEILFSFNISANIIHDNAGIGIAISQIHNGVVQGNTIRNQTTDGIEVVSCKHLTIADNNIYNPGAEGISVSGLEYSSITDNNIYSPGAKGIVCLNTLYSSIIGNNVLDATEEGIKIIANYCDVLYNLVFGAGDNGFELNVSQCNINDNISEGSAKVGIYFHGTSEQLNICNNLAIKSGTHGIQLGGSTTKNILFSGNSCLNNNQDAGSNYGFIAHNASGITVVDNDFSDYQGAPTQKIGAYLSYITSGLICHSNRATGNIQHQIIGGGGVDFNKYVDIFMDVLAVSANHVVNAQACHADPTTLTVGAGIAAQPDVPRTFSWTVNNAGGITAADITITGIDAKGNSITESFDLTGGLTGETNNAFATVSQVKIENQVNAAAGDTITVGITDVLGLSNIISATDDVYKIKKNNADAVVATAQANIAYDTYDMSVIGLAVTDDFTIWYKTNLNIIT